ncbi:MAG: DUF2191 domain-containing protein [Acidimicrobiaceae bacterium]|nr:DUF2191 domain-containing protein [Acidimicrobiaceae bacterium]MYE75491.1 DUF2191 domain-containing protein [Acidimicrobiaceae bacterium]MYJ42399.1 DUF2191 domain-containing protein [Acidimicrobiaceae bacterium]
MSRIRISTTVDEGLLERAKRSGAWNSVAAMVDAALEALVAAHREAQIDSAYEAYNERPIDEPDAWGSLADFHEANRRHREGGGVPSGGGSAG